MSEFITTKITEPDALDAELMIPKKDVIWLCVLLLGEDDKNGER